MIYQIVVFRAPHKVKLQPVNMVGYLEAQKNMYELIANFKQK